MVLLAINKLVIKKFDLLFLSSISSVNNKNNFVNVNSNRCYEFAVETECGNYCLDNYGDSYANAQATSENILNSCETLYSDTEEGRTQCWIYADNTFYTIRDQGWLFARCCIFQSCDCYEEGDEKWCDQIICC